jgi:hypothetical protein
MPHAMGLCRSGGDRQMLRPTLANESPNLSQMSYRHLEICVTLLSLP